MRIALTKVNGFGSSCEKQRDAMLGEMGEGRFVEAARRKSRFWVFFDNRLRSCRLAQCRRAPAPSRKPDDRVAHVRPRVDSRAVVRLRDGHVQRALGVRGCCVGHGEEVSTQSHRAAWTASRNRDHQFERFTGSPQLSDGPGVRAFHDLRADVGATLARAFGGSHLHGHCRCSDSASQRAVR